MTGFQAAALCAALVSLCACATPEIPFDRASAGDIKTIGLVTPAVPDRASVILASSIGQSFGLVGALVDATLQDGRETTFKAAVDKENYSQRDIFVQKLTADLEQRGYQIAPIAVTRTKKTSLLDKYPTDAEPKVDAYLDVVTNYYGYVAAGIANATPYRPTAFITLKLVRASDNKVLMQDRVVYNPLSFGGATVGDAVTIPPSPDYVFTDFDTLVADPPRAVKGMQDAAEQTAATISKLMQ